MKPMNCWLLLLVYILPVLGQKVREPYGWACYRMASKREWPECKQAAKSELRNCLCSLPSFVSWTEHCLSLAVVNATDRETAINSARKDSLCPATTKSGKKLNLNKMAADLVGEHEIATAVSTAHWRTVNDKRAISAGIALVAFWGLVVLAKMGLSCLVHQTPRSWTTKFMLTAPVRWFRARVVTAPVAPEFVQRLLSTNINTQLPERLAVLIVALFAVVNYGLMLGLPLPYVDLNFIYPTISQQRHKGISIRCAYMVMWKLPIVFFFAMTSHDIAWPLRVRKFFHKWIARITFADIVIHGIAISLVKVEQHLYGYVWSVKYWMYGVTGSIAAGLIILQTLRWVICCSYDAFKIIHAVLGVAFVLATWRHVQELPYGMHHTYAVVGIWSVDYLFRLINLLWNGKVTAYLYHHSDSVMTLTIRQQSKYSLVQMGTNQKSVYLHFLPWYLFWQSHPFSLTRELAPTSELPKTITGSVNELVGAEATKLGSVSISAEEKYSQSSTTQSMPSMGRIDSLEGDIVIGIRAKNGITGKLAQMNDGPITIGMNGPYESYFPLHRFQQVICFAGGVGITAIIGNLQHLMKKTGSLPNSNVKVYWTVPKFSEFEWAVRALEKLPISVQLEIYCTQEISGTSETSAETPELFGYSENTQIINGRMDVMAVVSNEVNLINADSRPQRLSTAVMACGPAGLNLDARKTTCWAIENASTFVDYFEEQFGW